MDINGISSLATTLATTATGQDAATAVLEKANEIQASTASALVQAIPPVSKPNLPSHLGKNIDTTA
jgi:hypothetical protein